MQDASYMLSRLEKLKSSEHPPAPKEPQLRLQFAPGEKLLHKVIDLQPFHAGASERSMSPEQRRQQKEIERICSEDGLVKELAPSPSVADLDSLYTRFPNAKPALDFIGRSLALAQRCWPSEVPLSLRPLLIVGPPGTGKTHFTHELAGALGTSWREVDIATASAGWLLAGCSGQWQDAKPGVIFQTLFGEEIRYANPLITLSELDKAGTDDRHSPIAPLLGLLEQDTARRFRDEFFDVAMDASKILYVGTANSVESISEPILSRFTVVEMQNCDDQQLQAIAKSIYMDTLAGESWGDTFGEPCDSTLQAMAKAGGGNPREMKRCLLDALGSAAMEFADCLNAGHFRNCSAPMKRRIGF